MRKINIKKESSYPVKSNRFTLRKFNATVLYIYLLLPIFSAGGISIFNENFTFKVFNSSQSDLIGRSLTRYRGSNVFLYRKAVVTIIVLIVRSTKLTDTYSSIAQISNR